MTITAVELENKAKSYLEAFEARDLAACMTFFDDSSTLHFHTSVFKGKQEIEHWHQDRFEADLRVLRVDDIRVEGDAVTIDAVGTSKRLRAWRLNSVSGAMTMRFNGNVVSDVSFAMQLSPW